MIESMSNLRPDTGYSNVRVSDWLRGKLIFVDSGLEGIITADWRLTWGLSVSKFISEHARPLRRLEIGSR